MEVSQNLAMEKAPGSEVVKHRGESFTRDQRQYLFELKMSGLRGEECVRRFNERYHLNGGERKAELTHGAFRKWFTIQKNLAQFDEYRFEQLLSIERRGLASRPARIEMLASIAAESACSNRDRIKAIEVIEGIMNRFEQDRDKHRPEQHVIVQMPALGPSDPLLDSPFFTTTESSLMALSEEHGETILAKIKKAVDEARRAGLLLPHDKQNAIEAEPIAPVSDGYDAEDEELSDSEGEE